MKKIRVMCVMLVVGLLLAACGNQKTIDSNIVKYEGTEYVLLEYPTNIFYYDYNGNSHDNFEEIDGIYPVVSPQWGMIWNGGDLYCVDNCSVEAKDYYADDDNYEWYILIDTEDEAEDMSPINVTDTELDAVYDMEEMERDTAVFFDEFEVLGSIIKTSKDGLVRGTLSIAKYDGKWYWKSEIIDESRTCDGTWPEYIQPLPETLNSKIEKVGI